MNPYRVVGDRTERTTLIRLEEPYPTIDIVTDLVGGTKAVPVSSVVITAGDETITSIRAKSTLFDHWVHYTQSWDQQPPDWLRGIVAELGFAMWEKP